ncbi:unnamed protein product, partial [Amoebophrya sp. A25]
VVTSAYLNRATYSRTLLELNFPPCASGFRNLIRDIQRCLPAVAARKRRSRTAARSRSHEKHKSNMYYARRSSDPNRRAVAFRMDEQMLKKVDKQVNDEIDQKCEELGHILAHFPPDIGEVLMAWAAGGDIGKAKCAATTCLNENGKQNSMLLVGQGKKEIESEKTLSPVFQPTKVGSLSTQNEVVGDDSIGTWVGRAIGMQGEREEVET